MSAPVILEESCVHRERREQEKTSEDGTELIPCNGQLFTGQLFTDATRRTLTAVTPTKLNSLIHLQGVIWRQLYH